MYCDMLVCLQHLLGSDTLLGSEVDEALRQHFQQRCGTVVTDEKQKAESKHLRGSWVSLALDSNAPGLAMKGNNSLAFSY